MTFENLIQSPRNIKAAPHSAVITSRVRLARNILDFPYPGWGTRDDRVELYKKIQKGISQLSFSKSAFFEELKGYEAIEKQVLVEQHLISRELASRSEGCGLLVNSGKSLAIMINEEDHFRLQAIQPGLNLKKAHRLLDKIDDQLSETFHFAFDQNLGFLTSCPTNVGTGMRASVMLHLPALSIMNQIEPTLKAVSNLGLAIRGFYGEGTETLGHLYQISNQSTLGESEKEIINRIERVVKYVIRAEENARLKCLEDDPNLMIDKIGRAYGTLMHAHILSSKEALSLLSLIRLGAAIDYFPEEAYDITHDLMIKIQPAHLQYHAGKKLSPDERDLARASVISEAIESLPPPKNS